MSQSAEADVEPVVLREEWRGMQRRLVERLTTGEKSDLAEDILELDPSVYTDPERFETERRLVFREVPLLVGLSSELAQPGDRLVFDAAGPPVLVVRDEQDSLQAFLNLCTHRGARLVESCSPGRRILCPFHGWTFDLAGKLASTPFAEAFEGLDRERRGLVRVPVGELGGMVFVKARPATGPDEHHIDVASWLGAIAPLLCALDLGSLTRIGDDELDVGANWKLALDMGREIYHVPVVHRSTLSPNLHPHIAIFDCYGPHNRFSGAGRDFDALVGKPEAEWPEMKYQGVHYLFPNTTLSFTHSVDGETPIVTMSRVFPGDSVGEATTRIATYRRHDANTADEQVQPMHAAILGVVGNEDYGIARQVWRSIHSAAPPLKFALGRNELLVQRFHQELAVRTAMPLP